MRRFFQLMVALLLMVWVLSPCQAETYYVDSQSGDDAAAGTSPETAWKTLSHPNEKERFHPGDQILFKRGGLWRGSLHLASGSEDHPIIYSTYGNGKKPKIFRSVSLCSPDQWKKEGDHLWYAEMGNMGVRDIGNIILDGKRAAWKRWRKENLTQQNDFWFDLKGDERLWFYSDRNPAEKYSSIEAAVMRHIIDHSNAQSVVVDGFDLRYGAAHGFGGMNASHITIRNCDISWIGGGNQHLSDDERNVRFGNGIEFWETTHDCLVENCRLWEIYDAALTNQGNSTSVQQNITYRNNTIWNCEYSFEYWHRPTDSLTENILFENNTCRNAGYGWGHEQRPDPNGRHFMAYQNSSKTRNVILRGNLFENATDSLFRLEDCKENPDWPATGLILENNTQKQIDGKPFYRWKREDFMEPLLDPSAL